MGLGVAAQGGAAAQEFDLNGVGYVLGSPEATVAPRNPGDFLHTYASQLGLDTGAFETCYEEDHGKDRTRRATRAAEGLDVSGTPTFFINGFRALGALTIEVFRALLEEAERGATSDGR